VVHEKESTVIRREEIIEVARRNEEVVDNESDHRVILEDVLHLTVENEAIQEKTREHNVKRISQIKEDRILEAIRSERTMIETKREVNSKVMVVLSKKIRLTKKVERRSWRSKYCLSRTMR